MLISFPKLQTHRNAGIAKKMFLQTAAEWTPTDGKLPRPEPPSAYRHDFPANKFDLKDNIFATRELMCYMATSFLTFLNNIDSDVFLAINGLHCQWTDPVMMALTNKWLWIALSIIPIALVFKRSGFVRGLLCLAFVSLAITIGDQVCASVIRPAVERLRPSCLDNPISGMVHIVDGYRSGTYGFPSCHGATTMAIAVFMSLYFQQRGATIFFFCWAVLMCYTRIYLGVHYPGDIIVGMMIGAAAALICFALYRFIVSRIDRHFPPTPA